MFSHRIAFFCVLQHRYELSRRISKKKKRLSFFLFFCWGVVWRKVFASLSFQKTHFAFLSQVTLIMCDFEEPSCLNLARLTFHLPSCL